MGIAELLIIVIPLVGQLVRSVIKDARDEKKSTWEKMADVATTAWEKTTDAAERIPELSGNQKVMRALDLWRALLELRPDTPDKPSKDDIKRAEQFFRALELEERAGNQRDAGELERIVNDATAAKRANAITVPLRR
jgi:hypothetical protein